MNIFKKAIAATALGASALVATASPAMARDHRGGGDDAAIAIGAGIVGLAIGALIASDNDNDRYDRRYHVRDGWYHRDGYYYNRSGHRYSRNDWERRYARNYNRNNRWDRRDNRRGYGDRYYYRRGF